MKYLMKILVSVLVPVLVSALIAGPGGAAPASGEAADERVVGVWAYGENGWYEFTDDGSWYFYYNADEGDPAGMSAFGKYVVNVDFLQMYTPDGSEYDSWTVNDDNLAQPEIQMTRAELPDFPETASDKAGIVGIWKYADGSGWIILYETDSWEACSAQEGLISAGETEILDDGTVQLSVVILDDDGSFGTEPLLTMTLLDEGLMQDANGAVLLQVETLDFGADPVPADMVGVWFYNDEWYEFTADGTWSVYNNYGLLLDGYCVSYSDEEVLLDLADGSVASSWMTGGASDEQGNTAVRSELPETFEDSGLTVTGIWQYEQEYRWLVVYPGGSWLMYDETDLLDAGTAAAGQDSTLLISDGEEASAETVSVLTMNDDGTVTDDSGAVLVPAQLPDFL